MGKIDEAWAAAAEVIRIAPKFSVDKFVKKLPFKDQDYSERWAESLRKAGLKWAVILKGRLSKLCDPLKKL